MDYTYLLTAITYPQTSGIAGSETLVSALNKTQLRLPAHSLTIRFIESLLITYQPGFS